MSVDANIELPLAWITTVYARLQAAGLHGANTLTSMACRAPDCPTAYKRQCLRKLERFPRQPARVLFHCAEMIVRPALEVSIRQFIRRNRLDLSFRYDRIVKLILCWQRKWNSAVSPHFFSL